MVKLFLIRCSKERISNKLNKTKIFYDFIYFLLHKNIFIQYLYFKLTLSFLKLVLEF